MGSLHLGMRWLIACLVTFVLQCSVAQDPEPLAQSPAQVLADLVEGTVVYADDEDVVIRTARSAPTVMRQFSGSPQVFPGGVEFSLRIEASGRSVYFAVRQGRATSDRFTGSDRPTPPSEGFYCESRSWRGGSVFECFDDGRRVSQTRCTTSRGVVSCRSYSYDTP